jgi:type II secretory pathway component PulF
MSELTMVGFALMFVYVILGYKRPAAAFITAPFAVVAFAYAAAGSFYQENLLLAPVLFVVAMAAVAASTRGADSREWFHWAASLLLIWFTLLLLLAVVLLGFHKLGAGAILPVLFILGVGAIIISSVSYGLASRRAVAINVFSTLGASMRQNLPLPMALDCAATGRYDATALVLRRIKTWMVKGYSLSEAVSRGYPQCPSRALAVLAAGERIDQLPAAVQAIEADVKSRAMDRAALRPVHPAYPVIMLTILFLFATGLAKFVLPQFKSIMAEMVEGELPAATRILLQITEPFIAGDAPLLLLLGGAMSVSGLCVYGAWRRRRLEKPYLLSQLGDLLKWHLPILHWFERNRALAQVVGLLRMSLDAGCPVNEAIRSTLRLDVNLYFHRRLACWLERVERGEAIGGSARRCGLGNTLAWAFEGGADTGNTPAVLEMLEAHYRSNYSYRVNLARFILWPVGIIMLGIAVGFVVFAVFSCVVAALSQNIANVYP